MEVIVEVDSSKAQYFKAKKYLDSQKIIKAKENGDLVLSFMVTQTIEIEEMILRWIPYIKVVSHISLKNTIKNRLHSYLK